MTSIPKHAHPVPSVRLIALDARGRILVLRRPAGSFMGGAWTLPGGKIDYGESPESAARRELLEETQLYAHDLRFLLWQDSPPVKPGAMHVINFYYECRVDAEPTLNAEESDAFVWLEPDDTRCDEIAFRGNEAVAQWRRETLR